MLVFAALLFVYLQAIMSVITIFIAVGGLHVFFGIFHQCYTKP